MIDGGIHTRSSIDFLCDRHLNTCKSSASTVLLGMYRFAAFFSVRMKTALYTILYVRYESLKLCEGSVDISSWPSGSPSFSPISLVNYLVQPLYTVFVVNLFSS